MLASGGSIRIRTRRFLPAQTTDEPMPSFVRRSAVLLFAAVYATFALLAPAPQFHDHCGDLQKATVRCHVAGLTSLTAPMGPREPLRSDCPACTISGMSAVPIGAPVMAPPGDRADRLVTFSRLAPRSPVEQSLGSRGPPAA